ncbi:MAG: ABC transporter permease [Thermoleophilia bacterium]|nr:ABC transporter permease [Thermoleophilia bacterium]
MMKTFSIAWKDTVHVYRDIAGLAMMFIAPLVLATVLGAAFGSGDNFSIAAVRTVIVDQDKGAGADAPAAGAMLSAALDSPDLRELLAVTKVDTPEEARSAVDDGDAAAAVIIPAGLSSALASAVAQEAKVEIYKDPALVVGPSIVAAVTESVVQTLNGSRAAAAAAARLAVFQGVTDTARLADIASKAGTAFALQARTDAQITVEARNPVLEGTIEKRPNVASQVLVGMMLFFMLFGAATPAHSVLEEHRNGTLSRLFTTPTPRSIILGGKFLAVFVVVLVQAAILLLAGLLLFRADWGEPGPVIVLTLCSAVVAASLGLVTVSFAKTVGQAGAVSSAVFVFLGLLSGNFTGTIVTSGPFATIRRISPVGWLLEGWSKVLYGGSWGSIAVPLLVALAFAVVFFAISVFFFRRRYA